MSSVIRIWGSALDVDKMLADGELPVDRIWRKGEERNRKGDLHPDSGITLLASDADLFDFDGQVAEARKYLEENAMILSKLTTFSHIDGAIIDFGVGIRRENLCKFCHLPHAFVHLAAELGLGIEISYYKCSDED